MQDVKEIDAAEITGGTDYADALCGVALGATVASTAFFGLAGFALTYGWAVTACTIAATT